MGVDGGGKTFELVVRESFRRRATVVISEFFPGGACLLADRLCLLLPCVPPGRRSLRCRFSFAFELVQAFLQLRLLLFDLDHMCTPQLLRHIHQPWFFGFSDSHDGSGVGTRQQRRNTQADRYISCGSDPVDQRFCIKPFSKLHPPYSDALAIEPAVLPLQWAQQRKPKVFSRRVRIIAAKENAERFG